MERPQSESQAQRVLDQWREASPGLDLSGKALSLRLHMVHTMTAERHAAALRRLGLKCGAFGVLVTLRRIGEPYELAPKELLAEVLFTSGGLSLLLDRLVAQGLVERRPNPSDRRGQLVALTPAGVETAELAMALQAESDLCLAESLSPEDRAHLQRILTQLLEAPGRV